jgi:1-acyl-sn-glycerol-3-phosphate acyltransferase
MLSVFTFFIALTSISYFAVALIILYPINKRLCAALAGFAVRRCPRRLFAVLRTYKKFRVYLELENEHELPEQYLIICNHQSLLDVPLYMVYLKDRVRFVAKEELSRHVPIISEILRAQEHCFLPRAGSPSRAMRVLDLFIERVYKQNLLPVIFPEGTRSRDGSLGTFYAAGFRRMLDKRPMPVAVFALDGGYKISTLDGIIRGMYKGVYRLKILKVFPAPMNKQEQVAILQQGKELIQKQLDTWRGAESAFAP